MSNTETKQKLCVNTKNTQLSKIRKHLHKYKKITSWEAIKEYRVTRLSHYILVLRSEGYDIDTIIKR